MSDNLMIKRIVLLKQKVATAKSMPVFKKAGAAEIIIDEAVDIIEMMAMEIIENGK